MPADPVRVLHIHSDLQSGGVEHWLLQAVRHIDRSLFNLEFFSASVSTNWERTISDLQLQLYRSPRPRQFWHYASALKQLLRIRRYDAVHCHSMDQAGALLRIAANAKVPVRIAHSHTHTGPALGPKQVLLRAYFRVQNLLLRQYATTGLAASQAAAQTMFGLRWNEAGRCRVLHCGIDLKPFEDPPDDGQLRRELGFGPADFVFGHVGRFSQEKNHAFLVKIALLLSRREPRARFLWIGDGPDKSKIERLVSRSQLNGRVVFAGVRNDVSRLMRCLMNAFLFPSLYEGLGLAVVEAQAAGLQCFVSDAVPAEASVVAPLLTRLKLSTGPELWTERILAKMNCRPPIAAQTALEIVRSSSFNIEHSARSLEELYLERH